MSSGTQPCRLHSRHSFATQIGGTKGKTSLPTVVVYVNDKTNDCPGFESAILVLVSGMTNLWVSLKSLPKADRM